LQRKWEQLVWVYHPWIALGMDTLNVFFGSFALGNNNIFAVVLTALVSVGLTFMLWRRRNSATAVTVDSEEATAATHKSRTRREGKKRRARAKKANAAAAATATATIETKAPAPALAPTVRAVAGNGINELSSNTVTAPVAVEYDDGNENEPIDDAGANTTGGQGAPSDGLQRAPVQLNDDPRLKADRAEPVHIGRVTTLASSSSGTKSKVAPPKPRVSTLPVAPESTGTSLYDGWMDVDGWINME
jgi:hypothetical protein